MREFRDHGNRFKHAEGYCGAGTAILPNLIERRVGNFGKRNNGRDQSKLILAVMAILRRQLSLCQATQCGPQVSQRLRWGGASTREAQTESSRCLPSPRPGATRCLTANTAASTRGTIKRSASAFFVDQVVRSNSKQWNATLTPLSLGLAMLDTTRPSAALHQLPWRRAFGSDDGDGGALA